MPLLMPMQIMTSKKKEAMTKNQSLIITQSRKRVMMREIMKPMKPRREITKVMKARKATMKVTKVMKVSMKVTRVIMKVMKVMNVQP